MRMSDEAFHDLANAILRLRHTFQKHGLASPVAIELGSHEDGDKLRANMPRDMILAQPEMGRSDERPDMVAHMVGMEIRYPARFRARERDGFDAV